VVDRSKHPHEAHYLRLDSTKASKRLGWKPKWDLAKAVEKVVEWTNAYQKKADLKQVCWQQIKEYMS
jgi:CDP-glucose 4,6-dehydratase